MLCSLDALETPGKTLTSHEHTRVFACDFGLFRCSHSFPMGLVFSSDPSFLASYSLFIECSFSLNVFPALSKLPDSNCLPAKFRWAGPRPVPPEIRNFGDSRENNYTKDAKKDRCEPK